MKSIEKDSKKLSDLKGRSNPGKKRGQSSYAPEADNSLLAIKLDNGKNSLEAPEKSPESKIISGNTKLNDFVTNSFGEKVPKNEIDARRKELLREDPEEYTKDPEALEEEVSAFIEGYRETFNISDLTKLNEKAKAEKKEESPLSVKDLEAVLKSKKFESAEDELLTSKSGAKISKTPNEIKSEIQNNKAEEKLVSDFKTLEDLQKRSGEGNSEDQSNQSTSNETKIISNESSLDVKKNVSNESDKSSSSGGFFQKIKENSLAALGSNTGRGVLEKLGGSILGESGQRLGSVLSQKSLMEKQKMEMGKLQESSPVSVKKISEPVEMKKSAPSAPKNPEPSQKQEPSDSEYPKKAEKSETFSSSSAKDSETSSKDSTNVPSRDLESNQGMGITKGDINDIKSLLTSINIALNSPLMVKNNKPFRPKSNMLE